MKIDDSFILTYSKCKVCNPYNLYEIDNNGNG